MVYVFGRPHEKSWTYDGQSGVLIYRDPELDEREAYRIQFSEAYTYGLWHDKITKKLESKDRNTVAKAKAMLKDKPTSLGALNSLRIKFALMCITGHKCWTTKEDGSVEALFGVIIAGDVVEILPDTPRDVWTHLYTEKMPDTLTSLALSLFDSAMLNAIAENADSDGDEEIPEPPQIPGFDGSYEELEAQHLGK